MKTLIRKTTPNGWFSPSLFATPFSLLDEVINEDFLSGRDYSTSLPAVNISEKADSFLVELSAPGFAKENFKIETKDGCLVVSAEVKEEKTEENRKFTRKEFSFGSFRRSFTLGNEVNTEAISAGYENGILRITLPKKEEAKPAAKEIRIS